LSSRIFLFTLNKNMRNFNDFMVAKRLDLNWLAETCVRKNINIIGLMQWYEEEGQYLPEHIQESIFSNMGHGAAAGGGYGTGIGGALGAAGGALFGNPLLGAGIGAGLGGLAGAAGGALYGAGKSLYDKYSKPSPGYEADKQAVLDALQKFAGHSGKYSKILTNMANYIAKNVTPSGAPTPGGKSGPAPTTTAPTTTAAPIPTATPASAWDIGADNIKLQNAGVDVRKANAKGVSYVTYHNAVLKHLNVGMDAADAEEAAKKELKIETALAKKYWNRFIQEYKKH
jgi:hypothetical protein